jgi:SH3-like domain-containing protein
MGKKIILFVLFLGLLGVGAAFAQDAAAPAPAQGTLALDAPPEKTSSSGLPIPRFVSLGADKVFVRTGPALRYPIKWVYQRANLPVEITQEFDTWRKIRDMDGDDGWVHQSLLSGERYGIVKGESNLALRKDPEEGGRILAVVEPNVVAQFRTCAGAWCEISADGYTGWAERKFLWGIYDSEDFD